MVTLLKGPNDIFKYASKSIQQDRCLEKIASIVSLGTRETVCELYLRQNDRAFIVQELQKKHELIYYVPENILETAELMVLRNDPIFIVHAMKGKIEAFGCASASLQKDPLLRSITCLLREYRFDAFEKYLNPSDMTSRKSSLHAYYCELLNEASDRFGPTINRFFNSADLLKAKNELVSALNGGSSLSEDAKSLLQADSYINSVLNALAQLRDLPDSNALFTQLMQTQRPKIL